MLKNYACTVKFDMNTVAKSVFLSDGGTQMIWVREEKPYPNHPERFESVAEVLCDKGLTRRHYWEVEWRGPWVDVAVAARVCRFGNTDESWCLYCFEDHYSARHNHLSMEIPNPMSHSHRVEGYLDWPGGTLSFYSVSSGTLSHLYTFHSTFTEPFYPGFAMQGHDCSVIICPARVSQLSRSASAERVDEF
ncbi:stonustoxin subunit alpha-like [Betta splendens]|uniref:Stonustoxin subunit alpha-like n=1 Tax=Betta splendens TaxID=158456 RepID=A0A6P7NF62_BETSP|nr:stonustoxin subunit alpha-like [Betta splendens]XP_040928077.1 stonustoxin subunit alpha-like [Betta splendens]